MDRISPVQSPRLAVLMVVLSELSMASSASLAKSMFAILPPAGVTTLRLLFSALVLACVFRPWRMGLPRNAWKSTCLYGAALVCMNFSFYLAIERIPLGVAVGIELMGPLTVAVVSSRRKLDFLWILFALSGLSLLLPLKNFTAALDPVGVGLAVLAGVCWALYIVFGKKNSGENGPVSVSIGMAFGAILIIPVGLVSTGTHLFEPYILAYGLALGIISSALPYTLEMFALRSMPAQTFGTLMSLSPALASLSAFFFLGEVLSVAQWCGLACIVVASAGTSMAGGR